MDRTWTGLTLALIAGVAGCGDDESIGGPTPPAAPIINIVVDANRDGVADPADREDQDHKGMWTAEHGASFLVNLDDDDGDGVRDCDDEILNGDADLADLARIVVSAWPGAPAGARGRFAIDAQSAENVRIWKHALDGTWQLVAGGLGPCGDAGPCTPAPELELTTEEVRAGLELGIEGMSFRKTEAPGAWTGVVELSYGITAKGGEPVTSDDAPDGVDRAVLRVAPWVLFGNLSPMDRVWSDSYSPEFVSGVRAATDDAGLEYRRYSNYNDQWTQDFFQTGWTAIPAAGGGVQGMRIANSRPWRQWGTVPPIEWLRGNYLGEDRGVLRIYRAENENKGDTYDSHGNHELLPPYENGGVAFPLGRILIGSGVMEETKDFYDAQGVQGPFFSVKTSWLWVGHVDEVVSFVPAATPRGWKLLVASPRLMRGMLEDAQAAGSGSAALFVGKQKWAGNSLVSATRTIDEALADAQLMQWSQQAQVEIDGVVAALRAEVGLAADEVVEIPGLFEDIDNQGKVAWSPGMVNLLAFGDHVVVPRPFGPIVGGVDILEESVKASLGTAQNQLGREGQGLRVYFADDWVTYHINDGEVHCGTNTEAPAPFSDVRWWEAGR